MGPGDPRHTREGMQPQDDTSIKCSAVPVGYAVLVVNLKKTLSTTSRDVTQNSPDCPGANRDRRSKLLIYVLTQSIDAQIRTQIAGPLGLGLFQGNAATISDFNDSIEGRGSRADIDKRLCANRPENSAARCFEFRLATGQYGVNEGQQLGAVRHMAVVGRLGNHGC